MPTYKLANTKEDFEAAATLFKEYAAWLAIDISFQHFEEELKVLPIMYGAANGGIILCLVGNVYVACVGIRRFNTTDAEMKRMWVKRGYEGQGIGKALLDKAIELAKECGYKKVKLDTLNDMLPAINLYCKNGFTEISAYYNNPDKRALYFEKIL